MIKIGYVIIPAMLIFLQSIFFCCSDNKEALKVNKDAAAAYNCESGAEIKAEYYSLSDNSLHFVKIIMPDGKRYTLPQIVSASGARYTDEREIEWWIKGDSAMIKGHSENGNWTDIYYKCEVAK
ncbi:MAG: MliC family protein [Ignavibacteriaceae bacterium]